MRIMSSEVWDGVEHRTNTKNTGGSKYKMTYVHPNIYVTVYRKTGHNAAPFEIFFVALTELSASRY